MPRLALSPTGGYYADPNRHWSAQDCVNYLPMKAERAGTRTPDQLRQCPGLRPFAPNLGGALRGLHNVEGKLFAVGGSSLYRIKSDVVIPYGTVPGTARVSMAHNAANELLTVNGSAGYLLNTASLAFAKVTDEGYPGASVVGFVDQYFPQVAPNGAYWFWSDLSNGAAYNTLDRAEAEADPDRIVTLFVSHREVLVFGRDTIEPFINTGAATGTFQRAANTVIECGCAARFSVAGMDNAVFFLDDKRVVRVLRGVTPERVSTAGIEQALGECTAEEISRAFAFTWEDRGHKVYYLTVPGRFTFGFDLLSGEWHRRLSPGLNTWRITSLVFWEGQWIGGDAEGKLYALDWDYHYDGQDELIRERVTGVLAADQRPVTVNEAELLFSVGGPASELDEWPEQPEGPTLVLGGADGTAGVFYAHTYTATGGTPPYTFSFAPGSTPPEGFTITTGGVFSGTAPDVGTIEPEIRVADANGLWDEGTESIAFQAPNWFFGPVAENGALGGSEAFYKKTTDPTDWSGAPIALPNGMSALGRISQSRGTLFFHPSDANENAQVSRNGGITFAAADHPLFATGENNYGIYWNGSYHHFRHLRSADGLTWTAIPNLPLAAADIDSYFARDSDGAVILAGVDGNIHTSLNNGATWTTRADPYSGATFYPFSTDGDRILGGAGGGIGVGYSDDLFATAATFVPDAGVTCTYANGAWLGLGGGQLRRSTTGAAFDDVQAVVTVLVINALIDYGQDVWAFADADGTEAIVYTSDDNGETFVAGDTLYSSAGSLVWGGA